LGESTDDGRMTNAQYRVAWKFLDRNGWHERDFDSYSLATWWERDLVLRGCETISIERLEDGEV